MRQQGLLRGPFLRYLLLLTLACGLTPRGYCDSVAETTCARLFACTTGAAERSALTSVYADEATCTKTFKTRSLCETQTEASLCKGQSWVPANASVCVEELRTLPCEQLATYRPTCVPPCR